MKHPTPFSVRRRVVAALALSLALAGCSSADSASGPEITTLPEVTLSDFETPDGGQQTDLSTLTGPLVVNLFASWCGPCEAEMPILEDFHDQYGDQVELIGIDHKDPNRGAAENLVEETGVTYRLLDDSRGDLDAAPPFPATRGLPFLAFVDAEGTVTNMQYVEITSVEQLVELVEEHLGVTL